MVRELRLDARLDMGVLTVSSELSKTFFALPSNNKKWKLQPFTTNVPDVHQLAQS